MVGVPMAEGFAEGHTKLVNCCLRDGSKTGSLPVFNTTYVSWGIELSDDLIYHREKTASLPHPSAKTGSLAVSSLWRWLQSPEPEPKLLSPWPIRRLPNWVDRVNTPLTDAELVAVRQCVQRSRPLGDERWVKSIVRRLGLESTMRPRGRQRARRVPEEQNKEASCRTEWIASTHRLPTRSWSLSGNVFSVADQWGTRDGWNRSCVDSVWGPAQCVRVAVRESTLCPKNTTKRPELPL